MAEVAKYVGVSRQCIFDAFQTRGYQLRSKKERPFKIYKGIKFTLRNSGYYSATTGSRKLMHRYMWEDQIGRIPDGWDIHHINEDKSDNRIDNFECLPKSEHTRKYSPHNNQFTKGRKLIKASNDTF